MTGEEEEKKKKKKRRKGQRKKGTLEMWVIPLAYTGSLYLLHRWVMP